MEDPAKVPELSIMKPPVGGASVGPAILSAPASETLLELVTSKDRTHPLFADAVHPDPVSVTS